MAGGAGRVDSGGRQQCVVEFFEPCQAAQSTDYGAWCTRPAQQSGPALACAYRMNRSTRKCSSVSGSARPTGKGRSGFSCPRSGPISARIRQPAPAGPGQRRRQLRMPPYCPGGRDSSLPGSRGDASANERRVRPMNSTLRGSKTRLPDCAPENARTSARSFRKTTIPPQSTGTTRAALRTCKTAPARPRPAPPRCRASVREGSRARPVRLEASNAQTAGSSTGDTRLAAPVVVTTVDVRSIKTDRWSVKRNPAGPSRALSMMLHLTTETYGLLNRSPHNREQSDNRIFRQDLTGQYSSERLSRLRRRPFCSNH